MDNDDDIAFASSKLEFQFYKDDVLYERKVLYVTLQIPSLYIYIYISVHFLKYSFSVDVNHMPLNNQNKNAKGSCRPTWQIFFICKIWTRPIVYTTINLTIKINDTTKNVGFANVWAEISQLISSVVGKTH